MLDMLKERVQQMEGGRRRRVGRPRKRRGGEIDGYEMSTMSELDGSGLVGGALVGGKRRVGRPRKGVIPPQFMAHIAALRKKSRRKQGRGLVGGGRTAQEIYEEYAMNEREMPDKVLQYLKAGIKPLTPKETLIKRFHLVEKKLGLPRTPTERLRKYKMDTLRKMIDLYKANPDVFAYPPVQAARDEYDDEDRFATAGYNFYEQAEKGSQARRVEPPSLFK